MPAIQELMLKDPEMMEDRFFVEIPAGENWQEWRQVFWGNEAVEVWYEPEQIWLKVVVDSWFIDDGSGNAPGASAHFFWKFEREGKKYKLDMDRDQRIRLSAPTIAELSARGKRCEDSVLVELGTRWNSDKYGPCFTPATRKVRGSWYCEEHAQRIEQMLLQNIHQEEKGHR